MSEQLEFQLASWAAQLEQRKADNDQLHNLRSVDHFFTFKDKKKADAAVAELRSLAFEANVTKRGLFKSLVAASHVSDLQDQTVRDLLHVVVGIAEKHDGIYDGFGAYVEA